MCYLNLSRIVEIADRLFPFELAETWDNCGIQIGDPDRTISAMAFSLDATPRTVMFARDHSCELLVTHHPVLVEPIRSIVPDSLAGRTLLAAGRFGVDILSLHTNLDAAQGGLNDKLAETLGLQAVSTPGTATCARVGRLVPAVTLFRFADMVAERLQISRPRIISPMDCSVETVFCASGSGMGYLREAITSRADVMLTGDVRYHAAREALEMGMPVIDAGHFGTERLAVELMADRFAEEFRRMNIEIACHRCDFESEPFVDIIDRKEDY
ncbi:MAG: Nif3-like dinuclear metal center hexameric protein [Desulfomonilaceae bacterium]|nr:Nif3-like dinuclear metal center hexameric protein [Desulfomonilaceae bacterium]